MASALGLLHGRPWCSTNTVCWHLLHVPAVCTTAKLHLAKNCVSFAADFASGSRRGHARPGARAGDTDPGRPSPGAQHPAPRAAAGRAAAAPAGRVRREALEPDPAGFGGHRRLNSSSRRGRGPTGGPGGGGRAGRQSWLRGGAGAGAGGAAGAGGGGRAGCRGCGGGTQVCHLWSAVGICVSMPFTAMPFTAESCNSAKYRDTKTAAVSGSLLASSSMLVIIFTHAAMRGEAARAQL